MTTPIITSAISDYVEYPGTFDVLGFRFPCALTLPARDGAARREAASAILLVPGSLFSDVNGDFPAWNVFPHVYAHLAHQLSARGHAVYRYAKPGPGTGTVTIDADVARANRTWASRLIVARAALADMRSRLGDTGIVFERTVLAGHSEGAVVATQLGAASERGSSNVPDDAGDVPGGVDGVVLLSGPSVGILSIMREQLGSFMPVGDVERARADFDEAVAALRHDASLPEELASRPAVRALAAMDPTGWRYMLDCEDTDPSSGAAGLQMPVLIVQGGRDGSVRPHHAERLRAARDGVPGRLTELVIFPELQHMYKRVPEGTPPMESFGWPGETDPRVADAIDEWISRLPAVSRRRHT